MALRLEHANFNVGDIDAMIRFLQTAFPEFRIRFEGSDADGQRWVHVGTDETYIALSGAQSDSVRRWVPYSGEAGVNHLAYEVDNVDGLRDRLLKAGYRESTVPNSHRHRKRIYFYDSEDNDWEFVQYYSSDPAERHDYDLPNE